MSRIHQRSYHLMAMLIVAIPVFAPRTMKAQEVSPPSVMQATSDSLSKPDVAH